MAGRAQSLLDRLSAEAADPVTLLVGAHYVVAAQLEFHLDTDHEVYSLSDDKPAADGRAVQLRLWGKDRRGLEERIGENALVTLMTVERGLYSASRHRMYVEDLCSLFSGVEKLDQQALWGGVKGFEYYLGTDLQPRDRPRRECLAVNLPLQGWTAGTLSEFQ